MDDIKILYNQSRCREQAMSSTFCRRVYSEVEEVGWDNLLKLGKDLTFISFRVMDEKGRTHVLEITLDKTYPKCPPSISADLPYSFNLEWSTNSKLIHVVQQFQEHVNKLQDFWSMVDDIDRSLWVTDPKQSHYATSHRQINIGDDCYMVLSISTTDPLSLPECRFLGSDPKANTFREIWMRNCNRWIKGKPFLENLSRVFDNQLPQPPHVQKNEEQVECGICYAPCLPIDDEVGANGESETDYTCENVKCHRAFHIDCLVEWLKSITTTRQSFDVLFGNCPYCSDPIAVKISTNK